MPVNRIARVSSSTSGLFPAVRSNSVPLAWDETNEQLIAKTTGGTVKRVPLTADANAALSAFALASGVSEANLIQYATGTITNAQIKALRATPKTLVAAPGSGLMLEFISAQLFLDYGSNVLTESADNLAIKYVDGSGQAISETIEATGFIDAAADTMIGVKPAASAALAKTAVANSALVLHNTGDGEYAGNAGADTVIYYRVAYRVHSTGW